jgi:hypothetical protein
VYLIGFMSLHKPTEPYIPDGFFALGGMVSSTEPQSGEGSPLDAAVTNALAVVFAK